jgi:hypothetical protein
MVKKSLIVILSLTVLAAAAAWFTRIDLLLAMVKFKSDREYVVAPNRDIAW